MLQKKGHNPDSNVEMAKPVTLYLSEENSKKMQGLNGTFCYRLGQKISTGIYFQLQQYKFCWNFLI